MKELKAVLPQINRVKAVNKIVRTKRSSQKRRSFFVDLFIFFYFIALLGVVVSQMLIQYGINMEVVLRKRTQFGQKEN